MHNTYYIGYDCSCVAVMSAVSLVIGSTRDKKQQEKLFISQTVSNSASVKVRFTSARIYKPSFRENWVYKCSFSNIGNDRFRLVLAKTGSINSGTDLAEADFI
jgi:hypothetical protein